MEDALELMPDILGDESVGVRYAINGLISLTPDGMPALGETPEVRGLWSVAASWIKEGPGIARTVAEWMTTGTSEIDAHTGDIARFHPHQRTRSYVRQRAYEHFSDTYAIVHPKEQAYSARNVRLAPMHAQEVGLGALFIEGGGWERPLYYESNSALLDDYAGRLMDRGDTWESKNWSPIINAEHLALRDRVGLVDLSAFCSFDVQGPGVVDYLQRLAVSQVDVAIGRVIYTSLLTPAGGIKADLTIMRLGPGVLPDRHRWRDRRPGQGVVRAQPAVRRQRAALRCDVGLDHDRRVGSAGPRPGRRADRGRRRQRGLRLRHLPGRSTSPACRSSRRGSPMSASSAGSCTCRSRPAPGCGTCSGRPVRRWASCRSGSASTRRRPGSRRATGPTATSWAPSTTWSRPA